MGKHDSGYERAERDLYPTPAWVVDALAEHVEFAGKVVWEPASGLGQMAVAIKALGASHVHQTDIVNRGVDGFSGVHDFAGSNEPFRIKGVDMIVTNPPYGVRNKLAEAFIERGLQYTRKRGLLALLLTADFDSAKTRARFFRECPAFLAKIVLTKRIKWFDHPDKDAGPKENHAWFLWESPSIGQKHMSRILYAPSLAEKDAA